MTDAENRNADARWLQALAGQFIVFDGPDGSGKSTQFSRFAAHCRHAGLTVCEVREPGGTNIGEQIRGVLLDPRNTEMALPAEMLLYMASRAQLIEQVVRPALEQRALVLADRFVSSTLAYQGTAGGMSPEQIMAVARVAIGDCWPGLTVVFDVDQQTAASRLNPLLDRMELKGEAFHKRVRQGYLDQAAADPDAHLVIDARFGPDEVFDALMAALRTRFEPNNHVQPEPVDVGA